jgi:hypothetical protein
MGAMQLDLTNFQPVTASEAVEQEVQDLRGAEQLSTPMIEREVPEGEVGVDFNKMRRFKMIQPILDMMFAMQSEMADKTSASLLRDRQMRHRMLRVNVNLKEFIDLDDVDEAVRKLKPLAAREADNTFEAFRKLIKN